MAPAIVWLSSGMRPGCRLMRNILADKPRVTKFPVEFDPPPDALQHLAAPDPVEAAAAAQTEMEGMEGGAARGTHAG